MVRTRSAVREKMREFVPETSMSSGEPAAVGHKLRQARLSKFGVVKNKLKSPSQKYIIPVGKGKAIAIDSQSESDSDFDAKSSSPRKNKVVVAKNDKFRAVGGNRKRPMNHIYSDEGDSEGPTKGIKGHKSNSQPPSHKIAFYSDEAVPYNYTTTDVLFNDIISRLYAEYVSKPTDGTIINTLSPVIDYMFGYKLACGAPWVEVDDIFFPIRIPRCAVRWVLGRLCLQDGHFWVYNSVTDDEVVRSVDEAVKPYSTLLPIFLDMVGFYKCRTDINLRYAGYRAKRIIDPFEVIVAENIPKPNPGDCGLYMVTFAEAFITDLEFDTITAKVARKRLAWILWNHGMLKNGYGSEEESPGDLPDDIREKVFTG